MPDRHVPERLDRPQPMRTHSVPLTEMQGAIPPTPYPRGYVERSGPEHSPCLCWIPTRIRCQQHGDGARRANWQA